MAFWKNNFLIGAIILVFAASLQAGTAADSLFRARDSLWAALIACGEKEYGRIRVLSEALDRVELALLNGPGRGIAPAADSGRPAGEREIFAIQAERLLLTEKLKKTGLVKDSLMNLLAELTLNGEEGGLRFEDELGNAPDPRKKGAVSPGSRSLEEEGARTALVARIDSLKKGASELEAALDRNTERMKSKLKGRKK